MAIAPPRPCARCGRLVRGRCPTCKQRRDREHDAARPGASARGYDAEWATLAREWLARYPWCGQRLDGRLYPDDSACTHRGERVAAECVDHIQALRAGGRRLDRRNLQSLCSDCNRRKGIRSEGGLGGRARSPRFRA